KAHPRPLAQRRPGAEPPRLERRLDAGPATGRPLAARRLRRSRRRAGVRPACLDTKPDVPDRSRPAAGLKKTLWPARTDAPPRAGEDHRRESARRDHRLTRRLLAPAFFWHLM